MKVQIKRLYLPSRIFTAIALVLIARFLLSGSRSTSRFLALLSVDSVTSLGIVTLSRESLITSLRSRRIVHITKVPHRLLNNSMLPVVLHELLIDLFLHRHRYAWKKRAEPFEFREKLTAHLTDRYRLSTAGLRVDLLLVLKELFIPVEKVRWR